MLRGAQRRLGPDCQGRERGEQSSSLEEFAPNLTATRQSDLAPGPGHSRKEPSLYRGAVSKDSVNFRHVSSGRRERRGSGRGSNETRKGKRHRLLTIESSAVQQNYNASHMRRFQF